MLFQHDEKLQASRAGRIKFLTILMNTLLLEI